MEGGGQFFEILGGRLLWTAPCVVLICWDKKSFFL